MSFLGDYVPAHGGFEDGKIDEDYVAYTPSGYDLRSNGGYTERNFHIIKGEDIPCEEGDCNPALDTWNPSSPREELKKRFQCLLLADIDWLKNQYKKKLRKFDLTEYLNNKCGKATMFDFDVNDNDVDVSAVNN